MKTSVALCTYNGEKFLSQQIDSILEQTVLVDEIVVCDDGSSDTTISILEDYKAKHPTIFKIFINDKNLRSVKNFEKAISLCDNEIIFLCDQDDIWVKNKVEKYVEFFEKNPNIEVLASNGFGIDEDNNILDIISIWDVPQFIKAKGFEFDYFNILNLLGNFCTGATMAVKKELKPYILPFPILEGFHHDEWIALVGAMKEKLHFLDEKLIYYREHSSQQVGGVFYKNTKKEKESLTNYFSIERKNKSFKDYKRLLKRLSSAYKKNTNLSEELPMHQEFFKNNLVEIKRKFHYFSHEMKLKHPLKFKFLKIADTFSGKRKI